MLTLSKPISAGQAQAYHRSEFANAKENYYTEGERVRGVWQGQLAERWGLKGEVNEEQFARLSEGQHPATGDALIRRQQAREFVNERGETVRTMEHRAGWDATFSAPKSVSVTALVGGDDRVRDAHRESVRVALDEMEKYAQARIGGNAPAQTTGAWAVAKFEHDSSRPVDGYAAPQLHTHAVIFNVTETAEGKTRSLQAQELYKTQQFATAVYRSELAARLQKLGYEIERGAHGQPEIKGYPFVTSRDTTASGFAMEVGLPPKLIDRVVMVIRTFPIRVGGTSGPFKNEISWEDVRDISGAPQSMPEFTSVTHKLRRVAQFDMDAVKRACDYNSPTSLAVMGLDRIEHKNQGLTKTHLLSERALHFIDELEERTGVPVEFGGTGFGTFDAVCFPALKRAEINHA